MRGGPERRDGASAAAVTFGAAREREGKGRSADDFTRRPLEFLGLTNWSFATRTGPSLR